jgi:hypothetical protein
MCIMEMRPGQKFSTMFMAMSHNQATLLGDVKFLEAILTQRDGGKHLAETKPLIERAVQNMKRAEADWLALFGMAVGEEGQDPEGHVHDHEHVGNERSLTEQAHTDASAARAYTTR